MSKSHEEQPKPKGKGMPIFPLVIEDLKAREAKGIETYGESLRADNGRNALQDLYEELLDAALYIKQAIVERGVPGPMETVGKAYDLWKSVSPPSVKFTGYVSSDLPMPCGSDGPAVEPPAQFKPETILEEAQRLVHGDRGDAYGHPLDDMGRTAGMLSSLLSDKLAQPLDARDVAMMMVCVKLSRERNKPKRDNRVDGCGYLETLQMITDEVERRGKQ